ncbi:uncharacterized protein LOC112089857 [Eutrema salsugineum]|uniref:uncharacterized protein LOC112089857 n=1 Tax=Eutrema salsugineum TaxID=72664 RepID=UPI000CED5B6E|nr:uncharacterized protein LOC112089857 [Eutrema salsugineum]
MTVVRNEKDELIPTRTVTGHRMCIDYRKLSATFRKDHFPLSFVDKMLERLVKQRCEESNLVMNWEKCHFMVKEGIVLGHKISEAGIEVDKAKVEVMVNLQAPSSFKELRSFLGHAGFYRRFIRNFSKIVRPLTRLLCKEVEFLFDKECEYAFTTIKKAFISAFIVQAPDWSLPFEIMTDASDFAVGAVLDQKKDKKLHVMYYASRTLDKA